MVYLNLISKLRQNQEKSRHLLNAIVDGYWAKQFHFTTNPGNMFPHPLFKDEKSEVWEG